MFERFTKQAREVVVGAQREARALRHGRIGTEHVLLALLAYPDAPGVATLVRQGVTAESCRAAIVELVGQGDLGEADSQALRAFGIDLDEVRRRAEHAFGEGALDVPPGSMDAERPGRFGLRRRRRGPAARGPGHIPFAARSKKALELSLREAIVLKDRHIGTEHVVLGLLRSDDAMTTGLFSRLGVEPRAVRTQVVTDLRRAA